MLNDSGFAMNHVSVIAKDPDRQTAIAGVKVKDEVTNRAETGTSVGAATGGVLGGVAGFLVGLGTLTIPGVGPAVLAGEAAAALSTLVGAAGGAVAGGLVGALIGMGIPEHRAKHYRDRVAQGDYLIMLKDTEPEIARAERTLKQAGIQDWGVYHAADSTTTGPAQTGDAADRLMQAAANPANQNPASGTGRQSDAADRMRDDRGDFQAPDTVSESGTGRRSEGVDQANPAVAAGRGNPYNRVDHPMDQNYPHDEPLSEGEARRQAGPPHASNPVDR
jgi:hypothetical protein